MKLIVGLGNPGAAYQYTRHNAGFAVLDILAARWETQFNREKFRGLIAETIYAGEKVLLLKPLTFMNNSGESVALAARNNVGDPNDMLVLYDEAELPLGRLRMRKDGSPGTHNGMRSVMERVGTRDVPRLRVGIGPGPGNGLTQHVLGKFAPDEREVVAVAFSRAADAVEMFVDKGIEAAMNTYNRDPKGEPPP